MKSSQISKVLNQLVGKSLWRCTRAADLVAFQFGARVAQVDFRGQPVEVGEIALHLQCPWRLVQGGRILVRAADMYCPPDSPNGTEPGENFDWDRQPNRFEQCIAGLFEGGREYPVAALNVGAAGAFSVQFTEGIWLEVFPNSSIAEEFWRLLAGPGTGPHFVVSSGGIEMVPFKPEIH